MVGLSATGALKLCKLLHSPDVRFALCYEPNTSLLYCTDDLIYRPYSNDVIGYADTGDDSLNSIGSSEEKVADHMLAVYVRGVYQNDCFSYPYVHIK